MIRAFIVEDEQPALERLKDLIDEITDVEIIGSNPSGKEAVQQIDSLKPDLLFLDIHLTDISGIDVLRLISHQPAIIFTTAYNQYAIEAFELRAVDYLLKPFSKERFEEAVDKVREKLQPDQDMTSTFKQLLQSWQPGKDYLTRIPSRIGDKIYILPDDEIVYFKSEDKVVFAYLADSDFIVNYTLEELQNRLHPDKFFRIHRSTIVNLNYVKTIEAWFGGGYKMKVKDKRNTELTISRSAGRLLREKLGW
ncbi:response regulator transcription factor [candidate division KSB1 bacterium]|nr:response regulator transcription factor [candidate division KSB1 bacterium]